jgi:hypothetical protein
LSNQQRRRQHYPRNRPPRRSAVISALGHKLPPAADPIHRVRRP